MMFAISDVLDRVKTQIGAKNDRALALKLGTSTAKISQWRRGDRSPEPDALARLYELAGLDPTPALLAKGAELSKGPARKYYEQLLKMVTAAGLAFAFTVLEQAANNQALTGKDCILWKIFTCIRRVNFLNDFQTVSAIIRAPWGARRNAYSIS